jgi:hypothetical protein
MKNFASQNCCSHLSSTEGRDRLFDASSVSVPDRFAPQTVIRAVLQCETTNSRKEVRDLVGEGMYPPSPKRGQHGRKHE